MRINAFQRYDFTADVMDYEISDDSNQTREYFYRETIPIAFANSPDSPRGTIYSKKPFRKDILLVRVLDRSGTEFLPEGMWRVTMVVPQMNTLGYVDGYLMSVAFAAEANWDPGAETEVS